MCASLKKQTLIGNLFLIIVVFAVSVFLWHTKDRLEIGEKKYLFLRKLLFPIYRFVIIHRYVSSCLHGAGSFLKV